MNNLEQNYNSRVSKADNNANQYASIVSKGPNKAVQ